MIDVARGGVRTGRHKHGKAPVPVLVGNKGRNHGVIAEDLHQGRGGKGRLLFTDELGNGLLDDAVTRGLPEEFGLQQRVNPFPEPCPQDHPNHETQQYQCQHDNDIGHDLW